MEKEYNVYSTDSRFLYIIVGFLEIIGTFINSYTADKYDGLMRCFLVRHHEIGGTDQINILKGADSISYFEVNLPFYFLRNNLKETKRRCLWGYRRLSDQGKNC